jgi:hypothetical protein
MVLILHNEKLLAAVRLSYLKSTKVSTRTEAFKKRKSIKVQKAALNAQ